MVGQLRTLEIPNLNTVYEDDTGELLLHNVKGDGSLLVLHADVIPTIDRRILEHYAVILNSLCEQLSQKGFPSLKTWVLTDEQMRYAVFFGFVPTGNEVTIEGYFGPPIYEMEKVLN